MLEWKCSKGSDIMIGTQCPSSFLLQEYSRLDERRFRSAWRHSLDRRWVDDRSVYERTFPPLPSS